MAVYGDEELAEGDFIGTKCHLASVLDSAFPHSDTDDEPGLTLKEELKEKKLCNYLVPVRKKLHPILLRPEFRVLG